MGGKVKKAPRKAMPKPEKVPAANTAQEAKWTAPEAAPAPAPVSGKRPEQPKGNAGGGFFGKLFRAIGGDDIASVLKKMSFVAVKPGTFTMGTEERFRSHVAFTFISLTRPDALASSLAKERPHTVTLHNAFELGAYPVTQREWQAVMGENPTRREIEGGNKPLCTDGSLLLSQVETFLDRLNGGQTEYIYRLPTEAEWEYACRAGTTTPWFFDVEKEAVPAPENTYTREELFRLVKKFENNFLRYAVFKHSEKEATLTNVGTKLPNPLGLYDMYGNVWELTQEGFFRGGGFGSGYMWCRTAVREDGRSDKKGLRLVRISREAQNPG